MVITSGGNDSTRPGHARFFDIVNDAGSHGQNRVYRVKWETIMKVDIGKGLTFDVDHAAMPQASAEHAAYIGWRNILMDAHASVTAEKYPDADSRNAAALAMAQKKYDAMLAGDVRVHVASGGRDPVRSRAIKIALGHVKVVKTADAKADAKAMRAAAIKRVDSNPAFIRLAKDQIAAEAELGMAEDVEIDESADDEAETAE